MHILPVRALDLPSVICVGLQPHQYLSGAGRLYWRRLMANGTVKWFNSQKGYGFIQPEDASRDVFVHVSAVERAGLGSLQEGQRLSYDLEKGQQGKVSAVNLRSA
jgi:cold shock protein